MKTDTAHLHLVRLGLTALFTGLTAAGAYFQIALPPVPITLQSFFVVLSGLLLPPRHAMLSQVLYLLIGFSGLPVFAGGTGGPAVLWSPTFGYLLAFPLAAFLTAILARSREPTLRNLALAAGGGAVTVLSIGSLYLAAATEWIVGQPIGLLRALLVGAVVFLPGELLKIAAAAWIAERLGRVRARTLNT